jgi:hypothetical protein
MEVIMFARMSRALAVAGVVAALSASWAGAAGAVPRPASSDVNLFASVSASGSLLAGTPGTTVARVARGRFEVTFSTNVSGCAYVATAVKAHAQAVMTWVASGQASNRAVFVETRYQDNGGYSAAPFNLVVDCGQPGWSYAVVGYSENLVRATPGTTLTPLTPGRYDVTFPTSVRDCAYLASSGDPGTGNDTNPINGIYTGSSSDPDQVYIETKNVGGGLSPGLPFHLEVICPSAAGTHFAVVRASGTAARHSNGTTSRRTATGEYVMTTHQSLAACAEVATRGSVNTSVPYSPTTVQIVPQSAANTIGIEVRDLLFFGGHLDSQSFHVAAVC